MSVVGARSAQAANAVEAVRRALGPAPLYAASARRVLRRQGLRRLGERLRPLDDRLVFVAGSPRSGTTFLAGCIGSMPGFVDLTEVNPHKAAISTLAGLDEATAAARIRRTLDRVRLLALVPGLRAVEQTPETAYVLGAALRAYPEARAVHLIRDGRDVVCSLLERGWLSHGREGGDDARLAYGAGSRFWVAPDRAGEFETASDATRAAWAWRCYVTAARRVSAADTEPGRRALEIRYEEIAADPATGAARIATHLGVDPASLAASLESIHTRSIGRFRDELSEEQLADVEREAGSLLRELGYV